MAANANAKSVRRRLQRQLEFYLSASNLRQDKFLQQHMDEQGFLPAVLFLSFNRVETLRATEKLLLEAATKSDMLRVDEAHAAIAPAEAALQEAMALGGDTADDHTLYVEGYDVNAHDHDSLRKVFAVFGKVNLVSMPRFSPSRKFKGFAFVEFAAQAAAQQALQAIDKRNQDASLGGMRAMSKRQWTEMKEKLKAQLCGGAGTKPTPASNEATTTKPKPASKEPSVTSEPPKSTKRLVSASGKASNGHVRFRDDDEQDSPTNIKRPCTEK